MTEQKDKVVLLGLVVGSLKQQAQVAQYAHTQLGFDQAPPGGFLSTPDALSRAAEELSTTALETASHAPTAPSVVGRQLDYLHAQSGALIDQAERYLAFVRRHAEMIRHGQRGGAVGYTGFEAGLKVESEAHSLSAQLTALEAFIRIVDSVAHQSVAVVTGAMSIDA